MLIKMTLKVLKNLFGGTHKIASTEIAVRDGKGIAVTLDTLPHGFQYSTKEQWTGQYWIDGSKIYTKTLSITVSKNDTHVTIQHNILNVKSMWIDESNSFLIENNAAKGATKQPINWSYIGYYNACYITNNYEIVYRMHWTGVINLTVRYICTDR